MKKLVLSIVATSIIVFGCTKEKEVIQQPNQLQSQSAAAQKEGGDDDDDPIVMEIVKDTNGVPVNKASIVFIKGTDTLKGSSDSLGICTLTLKETGYWNIHISKAGFDCIYDQANFVDSFTTRAETLQAGQCQ